MYRRTGPAAIVLSIIVVFAATGCSGGTPTATPIPVATTADEFAEAWCSSLQAMARAIGNPDTAADSKLSAALDAAIERGDYAGVEQVAAQMKAELETGRRFAAVGAGWQPGAATMVQLDRLILAFAAMVEAKRAAASQGLGAVDRLAQTAFEQAGGLEAWQGMFEAARSLPAEDLEGMTDCRWWEAGAAERLRPTT
jgi:hypothetical protein